MGHYDRIHSGGDYSRQILISFPWRHDHVLDLVTKEEGQGENFDRLIITFIFHVELWLCSYDFMLCDSAAVGQT